MKVTRAVVVKHFSTKHCNGRPSGDASRYGYVSRPVMVAHTNDSGLKVVIAVIFYKYRADYHNSTNGYDCCSPTWSTIKVVTALKSWRLARVYGYRFSPGITFGLVPLN